ncbi:MAG TPA: CBS domain-containing protein [Polyangia bacterium]
MPHSPDETPGSPNEARRSRILPDDRDRYSTERVGYATGLAEDELEAAPLPRARPSPAETPRLDGPRRWQPPSGPGASPDAPPGGGPLANPARPWGSLAPRDPSEVSRERDTSPREPLMVGDLMTRNVATVTSRTTLAEAAAMMRDENVGVLPVVDQDGRLDGIVTDRDLVVRGLAESGSRPLRELPVAAVASAEVEAVSPRQPIGEVLELMGRRQIRRAPVVSEQRRLIGMISLGDIACRAEYDRELQQALHQISSA